MESLCSVENELSIKEAHEPKGVYGVLSTRYIRYQRVTSLWRGREGILPISI